MENFKMKNNQRDLIKEFEIDKMEEKEQEKILMRIQKIIIQRSISRAIDKLSEKEQKEIEKKMQKNNWDEREILKILKEKISNFDTIVDQETDNFRELSLNIADKIKESEKKEE